MMASMHCLNVAMVWWGKPVILHILLSKGRQVREYIAARSSHPLGIWTHIKGRDLGVQPLANVPSLEEGLSEAQMSMSQMELIRDVWYLDDEQLWEVLEALQTKMAQRDGSHLKWDHLREI